MSLPYKHKGYLMEPVELVDCVEKTWTLYGAASVMLLGLFLMTLVIVTLIVWAIREREFAFLGFMAFMVLFMVSVNYLNIQVNTNPETETEIVFCDEVSYED